MKVYVLQHLHELDVDREDVKFIGVYSSESAAIAAIARLREKPGFSSAPDGFHVDEYELDVDQWVDGYATVIGEDRCNDPAAKLLESGNAASQRP